MTSSAHQLDIANPVTINYTVVPMTDRFSDINDLHSQAVEGDREARRNLFTLLSARLQTIALYSLWDRNDAEEAVQEALLTIAEKYIEVKDHENFHAWALTVLRHRILGIIRKRRVIDKVEIREEGVANVSPTAKGYDPMFRRRLLDCLKKIHSVNKRYARILNLQHSGYSPSEIGRMLGLTRNNVYSVLHRSRVMLQKCLDTGEVK